VIKPHRDRYVVFGTEQAAIATVVVAIHEIWQGVVMAVADCWDQLRTERWCGVAASTMFVDGKGAVCGCFEGGGMACLRMLSQWP